MKFEFSLVYLIGFSVSGVILWYILDTLNIKNAVEYSVFLVILLITGLIVGLFHGKGILDSPIKSINISGSAITYRNGLVYTRKIFSPIKNFEKSSNKILSFKYKRQRYR
ncbi:MAG TPA: hypothetical protein VMX55_15305 [candidate division Zixibacteria bacterium]|nr:hypothetical protein [candidate division Zixibacteria bacterium]